MEKNKRRKGRRERNPYYIEDQTAAAEEYVAKMQAWREEEKASRTTGDKIYSFLTSAVIGIPMVGLCLYIAWKVIGVFIALLYGISQG